MEIEPTNYATDIESLKKDTRVQPFRASGPGGQHRNKVETGIRLFHDVSGITVEAKDSRSREQNLEQAFKRLQRRLQVLNRKQTPRIPTKVPPSQKRQRLENAWKRIVEHYKIQLSSELKVMIEPDDPSFCRDDEGNELDTCVEIERGQFDRLIHSFSSYRFLVLLILNRSRFFHSLRCLELLTGSTRVRCGF